MSAALPPSVSPAVEHQLFWLLVKKAHRRDDVNRVYLAIQAALASGRKIVDVGAMLGALMPEGRRTLDDTSEPIGADGLAYFCWLFEVELREVGEADQHVYRFRRRHDGATVDANLRTAPAPKGLQFQQVYERHRRTLEATRAELLRKTRWGHRDERLSEPFM